MSKKLRRRILFPLFCLAFIIVAADLFFRSYVKTLPEPLGFCGQTYFDSSYPFELQTISRVGYLSNPKRSSFRNFSPEKGKDIIRLGCFGDSFTYGDETNERNDYPDLLQQLFYQHGFANVEVINFGVCGYGFHQVFLLWQAAVQLYQLDYTLLGPLSFQWDRDTTFQANGFFACHSRFIIENGELKLLDPIGDTPIARVRQGRTLIPKLQYLRYDRLTPTFLKALLPRNRDFTVNPFYYWHGSPQDEAMATYKLLLARMAESGRQIVLLHKDVDLVHAAKELRLPNLKYCYLEHHGELSHMPYPAPGGHYGPMGNQIVAQAMFDLLQGKSETRLALMTPSESLEGSGEADLSVSAYDDIGVGVEQTMLARFTELTDSSSTMTHRMIENKEINSFLALKDQSMSLANSLFIPLKERFEEGSPVALEIETDSGRQDYPVGSLHWLTPHGVIAVVEFTEAKLTFEDFKVKFDLYGDINQLRGEIDGAKPFRNAALTIRKNAVASFIIEGVNKHDERYLRRTGRFKPQVANFYKLTADPDGIISTENLPESGTFLLYLRAADGQERYFPFIKWRRTYWDMNLDRPIQQPITR